MSEHTEDDLRGALRSLAPEDLDVSDFRARLDATLAAEPEQPEATDGDVTVLPVDWAAPRGHRAGRIAAVAIAACAAAVVALLVAVLPSRTARTEKPAAPPSVPAAVRSMILPGTIVIQTYQGHGSSTFVVPSRAVPAHFSYTAYGTCSGSGKLGVGQGTLIGACDNGAFGTDNVVEKGRLVITAQPATSWQITLTIAPEFQTNGSVQNPVDADLSGPANGVRQSGRGSSTVTFAGETPPDIPATHYRVRLVCTGNGVTLPGLAATRAKGLQTRTCFAGHEYVWDSVALTTPARVRVEATPGTTWTIAIDPM